MCDYVNLRMMVISNEYSQDKEEREIDQYQDTVKTERY